MTEIYNADMADIKEDIIDYFENDDTFNSYNFEGSTTNNIINIFSLIEQNATFYLNSTANEFFIKQSVQKKNIYKNARKLNYFPIRKSAGYIEVIITSTIDTVVPIFSEFRLGVLTLYLFENVTLDTSNSRTATVLLYEGTLITETSIVDKTELFTVTLETEYSDIDNDYVYVYVDPLVGSEYPVTDNLWINADNEIIDTFSDSYLTSFTDTTYTIQFDNGRIFNVPDITDQIRTVYLNTSGTTVNGTGGEVTTEISDLTVDAGSNVIVNGTDEETDEEIKVRASLFYSSQKRGVTENDWNVIIKRYSKYDIFKDSLIWGGEKENVSVLFGDNIVETPDTYQNIGKIIISTIKENYDFLTTTEKDNLLLYLENFKIAGLQLRFLEPNILTYDTVVSINTNPSLTFSQSEFETEVNNYLTDLEGFNQQFKKSNLTQFIDDQSSIVYSDVSYTASVTVNNETHKVIRIGSAVTSMTGTVDGKLLTDNGSGIVRYDSIDVGTINYTTGFITLDSAISSLPTYEFDVVLTSDLFSQSINETILRFNDITVINI